MLLNVVLMLAGFATLIGGAEFLVRGASRLAARLGLSAMFIGLTVVACGTSLPEFVVSLLAALENAPDIAAGNVIGSNIFNLGVVLGLAALLAPIPLGETNLWRDMGISVAATVMLGLLVIGNRLGRLESAVLFAGLLSYLALTYSVAQRSKTPGETTLDIVARIVLGRDQLGGVAKNAALVVVGLGLLVLGARWSVHGAVNIADRAGVSPAVIGLTIVAAGTSLPELATTVVAALRRESAIAIGNILGSNTFNILGILGISGMIRPLTVSRDLVHYDIPVALGFSLLCWPLLRSGRRLSRPEGLALLAAYVAYALWLLLARTPAA
ncbi:MAG: calcium/sodium antiporter [Gemmatimonadota bacterium]|nr:MAG: calcium/sodium antiporter [Gemmatimonadota bacterium]